MYAYITHLEQLLTHGHFLKNKIWINKIGKWIIDSLFTSKNLIEFKDNLEISGNKNKNKYVLYKVLFKCFTYIKWLILTKTHFVGTILLQFYFKKSSEAQKGKVMHLRYSDCKWNDWDLIPGNLAQKSILLTTTRRIRWGK